ncbi:MAG TPA: hypothetical protein VFX98_02440 [Longimicrobiaceae bacterium]|nr:hypothetical protein [Longimicrobiaceae bacterium]
MTIEVVSFIAGVILVAVGVIGGGFELKELKIPRVGAIARVFSLGIGMFFVSLGIGLDDRLAPSAAASLGPTGANPLLSTQAQEPAPEAAAEAEAVARPEPVAATEPEPVQEASPQAFTGFDGEYRLSWTMEGVLYQAAFRTAGHAGAVWVSYVHPATGAVMQVQQDVALREAEGRIFYEGSNPRHADSQQPTADYQPDFFIIEQMKDGSWTISQVCDQTACAPAAVG